MIPSDVVCALLLKPITADESKHSADWHVDADQTMATPKINQLITPLEISSFRVYWTYWAWWRRPMCLDVTSVNWVIKGLFGDMPLPQSVMAYFGWILRMFQLQLNQSIIIKKKYIRKCRLQVVAHYVLAQICWSSGFGAHILKQFADWGTCKWTLNGVLYVSFLIPRSRRLEFNSEFSLKSVPEGPINNIAALVQIMTWRRPDDNLLSEPIMIRLLTHLVTRPPPLSLPRQRYQ